MNQSRTGVDRQQPRWRRDKVIELASQGHTERDIAAELNLSRPTMHRDLQILKLKAADHIQHYIDEELPAEYENTLLGLNRTLGILVVFKL